MIKNKISDYVSKALYDDKALTKFLDFEEQKEIFAAKVNGLNVYLFGGNSDCERKRAIISYNEPKEEDFKIAILESKIVMSLELLCLWVLNVIPLVTF